MRITLADEFFIEASASHHVVVGKGDGVEPHFLAELLVPLNALVGHAQELFCRRTALAFEPRKRRFHVPMRLAGFAQRDRVLQSGARAGADREVNGAQRVADEDNVLVMPVTVRHARVIAHDGFVRKQGVPAQVFLEHAFAVPVAFLFGHLRESGCLPSGLLAFDDERAVSLAIAVGMSNERAGRAVPENEGEAFERLVRAVPRVPVRSLFERRLKMLLECAADLAVYAIGADQ